MEIPAFSQSTCRIKIKTIFTLIIVKTKRVIYVLFIVTLGFIAQNLLGLEQRAFSSGKSKNTGDSVPTLNVYTWVDYLDPEIVSDFEKEFHVKVHVDFYDLEDAMYSLVQSEPGRYDLVFPSEGSMDEMIKSKLLLKFDEPDIPNLRNLHARFRTIINKWKGYCVPIDWGVTGIAYNAKYVKDTVDSWRIFWDVKYKGHTALVNDPYEVMSVGLKLLGYQLNPQNPNELDATLKILKKLKPLLHNECFIAYNEIREKLRNETLWIAQCYNGDAAILNDEDNDIKFVVPKEGTSFWIDVVAIPVGARNKRRAESFINFMLRPEISALQANYSYYASCNKKAWRYVKKDILKNPYIFIDKRTINKLEFYKILQPDVQRKFNECWAELLSK